MKDLFRLEAGAVRRNQVLRGASGAGHEMDLLFEICLKGKKYPVVVECKDAARPVGKEKIAAFQSVLRDVNEIRRGKKLFGIMVSSGGYQSGAVELALHGGILLWEIRRPGEKEWRDYVRRFLSGFGQMELSLRMNERVRVDVDDARGYGRGSWKMDTPLARDAFSLMYQGKSLAEWLEREVGKEQGVRREARIKDPDGRLSHLVWDGEMPVRELDFACVDLTEEAKDAILYGYKKPDLILSDPVRGWSAGIWDGKIRKLPDPVEEIREYDGAVGLRSE